ncbi:hypothetical protein ACFWPH_30185, partial [Nocardia sp. NPDC058499]
LYPREFFCATNNSIQPPNSTLGCCPRILGHLKTVATLIAEGVDAKTAAKQLGHARQGITERHYIASAEMAPDSSAVLEKGLGRAS